MRRRKTDYSDKAKPKAKAVAMAMGRAGSVGGMSAAMNGGENADADGIRRDGDEAKAVCEYPTYRQSDCQSLEAR